MGSSEDLRPPRGFMKPRDTEGVSVHSYLTLRVRWWFAAPYTLTWTAFVGYILLSGEQNRVWVSLNKIYDTCTSQWWSVQRRDMVSTALNNLDLKLSKKLTIAFYIGYHGQYDCTKTYWNISISWCWLGFSTCLPFILALGRPWSWTLVGLNLNSMAKGEKQCSYNFIFLMSHSLMSSGNWIALS